MSSRGCNYTLVSREKVDEIDKHVHPLYEDD